MAPPHMKKFQDSQEALQGSKSKIFECGVRGKDFSNAQPSLKSLSPSPLAHSGVVDRFYHCRVVETRFYNSAIMCARIIIEMDSHLSKIAPWSSR